MRRFTISLIILLIGVGVAHAGEMDSLTTFQAMVRAGMERTIRVKDSVNLFYLTNMAANIVNLEFQSKVTREAIPMQANVVEYGVDSSAFTNLVNVALWVSGQQSSNPPPKFTRALEYVEPGMIGKSQSKVPSQWTIQGYSIILDHSVSGDSLVVFYPTPPTRMIDYNDSPGIDDADATAIGLLTTAMGWASEGKVTLAKLWYSWYQAFKVNRVRSSGGQSQSQQ